MLEIYNTDTQYYTNTYTIIQYYTTGKPTTCGEGTYISTDLRGTPIREVWWRECRVFERLRMNRKKSMGSSSSSTRPNTPNVLPTTRRAFTALPSR